MSEDRHVADDVVMLPAKKHQIVLLVLEVRSHRTGRYVVNIGAGPNAVRVLAASLVPVEDLLAEFRPPPVPFRPQRCPPLQRPTPLHDPPLTVNAAHPHPDQWHISPSW